MFRSHSSGGFGRRAVPALPLLLLAALATGLQAQSIPSRAAPDARHAPSSADTIRPVPPRPTTMRGDLLPDRTFWAGAGIALGGAALLDRTLADDVPPGGGARWEGAADLLNHLGRPKELFPALAGLHVAGRLAGRDRLADGTAHAAGALLAAGVVNGALKVAVGRERPGVADDADAFHPFALDNARQSFPSGHTVVAFSLATAAAMETEDARVAALGYATAALVGWSRVYEDKHWASDVVAGAVVGTVSTRVALVVLHRLDPHRPEDGAEQLARGRGRDERESGSRTTITVSPRAVVVSVPVG